MKSIDVSIVICSYKRPDMLRDALDSLIVQQTDGRFSYEIVVVINDLPDGTQAVIDEANRSAQVPVRSVLEPRRGQVPARNRGIAEARGEWIANFDDDQIAEPTWLKELLAIAQQTGARSVGGALDLLLPEDCDLELTQFCRRMLGASVDWDTPRPYTRREGPGTGNLMLHRSIFEKVGVYDESFTLRGYDTDLYRRIREAGLESWFTPKALAHHVTPASRLTDKYFRETFLHNGWSFARRDQAERSLPRVLMTLTARLGQAVCINLPRRAWAWLRRDRAKSLEARCRLWRAEGYTRCVLYSLAPKVFSQRGFFSRFEFRAEHHHFATE